MYSLPSGLKRRELGNQLEMPQPLDQETGKRLPVRGYTAGEPTGAITFAELDATAIPEPVLKVPYIPPSKTETKHYTGYREGQDPEVDKWMKKWGRHYRRVRQYDDIIEREAKANGVDPDLVRAIIMQESGGRADVKSHAGAAGLMQLMPGTAKYLGVKDPLDPEQNIRGGVKYINEMLGRKQMKKVKDMTEREKIALAAYNAGPGNVSKYKGVPPFKETKHYVKAVPGFKDMIKRVRKYEIPEVTKAAIEKVPIKPISVNRNIGAKISTMPMPTGQAYKDPTLIERILAI